MDNAPAHPIVGKMGAMIDARLAEMNAGGWDIGFETQPANSPDCNTLDLAFFRAIQSLQYQKCAKNIDEFCAHVLEAFADLPLDVCKKVWTTAQIVMNQILIQNGNNDYKLPHVGKLKVEKAVGGDIPLRLPCRALINNKALECEYIIQFIGKLIVVSYVASSSVHPTATSADGNDAVLWLGLSPRSQSSSSFSWSSTSPCVLAIAIILAITRHGLLTIPRRQQPSNRRRGPPWPAQP
jgi:hypothetical protein